MTWDWQKFLQDLPGKALDFLKEYGPSLLWAVVTYMVGKWLARLVRAVISKLMTRAKVEPTLTSFVSNMAYMAMMLFVIIASLDRLHVDTKSFVALVGAAGLAIGFALQGSLANFAAGVMIIMFRPFKLGDQIDAAGVSGVVEEILIFSTILKTADNKKIIVPNSSMTGGNIVNYSAHPNRRVDMSFAAAGSEDLLRVKKILEQILAANPRVLKDPAPAVAVSGLVEGGVAFAVQPWVRTPDYGKVLSEVHEAVKLEFEKQKVQGPRKESWVRQIA